MSASSLVRFIRRDLILSGMAAVIAILLVVIAWQSLGGLNREDREALAKWRAFQEQMQAQSKYALQNFEKDIEKDRKKREEESLAEEKRMRDEDEARKAKRLKDLLDTEEESLTQYKYLMDRREFGEAAALSTAAKDVWGTVSDKRRVAEWDKRWLEARFQEKMAEPAKPRN